MADANDVVSVSLSDVAYSLKVTPAHMKQSLERFLSVVPEAGEHIEAIEEIIRGAHGGRCVTYLLDTVALMAFMYWRDHNGRLPRFFGVQRRVIEGGAHGR